MCNLELQSKPCFKVREQFSLNARFHQVINANMVEDRPFCVCDVSNREVKFGIPMKPITFHSRCYLVKLANTDREKLIADQFPRIWTDFQICP